MGAGTRIKAVPAPAPGKGQGAHSPDTFSSRYLALKEQAVSYEQEGFNKKSIEYKFYEKQNWEKLKTEFFTASEVNAAYTYPDAGTFAQAKWKKPASQKIAVMIIGRFPTSVVPWLGDWTFERFEEHWTHDKRVERLALALQERASAGVISYSLASFYVDEMTKMKAWLDQLQLQTNGSLFPPMPKMASSKAQRREEMAEWRGQIRFVLGLQKKLLNLLDQARSSIQHSMGGEQAVLSSLVSAVAKDAINSPVPLGEGSDRLRGLLVRMTEVAVQRANLYGIKVPENVIDVGTTGADSKSTVQ
jgi:hypothetical protein